MPTLVGRMPLGAKRADLRLPAPSRRNLAATSRHNLTIPPPCFGQT